MKAALDLNRWQYRIDRATNNLLKFLGLPSRRFTRSAHGPYLETVADDRTFAFSIRGYGRFLANILRDQDRPFVFLDIGSNTGLFSLVAAQNPKCRQALAFEPVAEVFDRLERNVVRNRAARVQPVHGAIAAGTAAQVQMTYDPAHSGMSRIVGDQGNVSAPRIGAQALSALVTDGAADVLVKIDVEGAEAGVLHVLYETTFLPRISKIVVELSETTQGKDGMAEVIALLGDAGFTEKARSGNADHFDALFAR